MLLTEDFFAAASSLHENKHPVHILEEAKALLADRERWSRYHYALDIDGNRVHPGDPAAVRWSMEGAVARCCNKWAILPPYFYRLLTYVVEQYGVEDGPCCFDQYYEHETVLQALQGAINLVIGGGRIT
jgi:hypothetical protein